MDAGNNLTASVITNNQVRISDGELMMQGRHIKLDPGTYVDLAIDNGAQAYLRHDIIVARYTRDTDTGVEECSLVVIKGIAAASDPADPAHVTGDLNGNKDRQHDFPLYRVKLNGLTLEGVEALFTPQPSLFDIAVRGYAHNLLDNSYFRDSHRIVNQRGFAGGAPSADNVYFIDRWKTQQNTTKNIEINFSDSGLIINVSTGLAGIAQRILTPKTDVTFAAKVNGKIASVHAKYGEDASAKTEDNVLLYVEWLEDVLQVIIRNTGEEANTYTVEWAALYEGEYTAETMPPYVPKGYAEEVAECIRYYCFGGRYYSHAMTKYNLYNSAVKTLFPMRARPTITLVSPSTNAQNRIYCSGVGDIDSYSVIVDSFIGGVVSSPNGGFVANNEYTWYAYFSADL
jgi:hypothetical protein